MRAVRPEMPLLQEFHERYGDQVAVVGSTTRTPRPSALESAATRRDLPAGGRPRGRPRRSGPLRIPGLPPWSSWTPRQVAHRSSRRSSPPRSSRPGRRAPRGRACERAPEWLRPVEEAARPITVHDLTRFTAARGRRHRAGRGPDALRRARRRPDLLLTERAHHMRSHPGQVSFPAGPSTRARPRQAALREAEEETGLDPAGVEVFASSAALAAAEQLRRHAGARLVARAEPVSTWSTPTRSTRSTGSRVSDLLDPTHRITVRTRAAGVSPGFLIGHDDDVILLGVHRRHHRPAVRLRRLDRATWDAAPGSCRPTCCGVGPGSTIDDVHPEHRFRRRARTPVNWLDWLLLLLVAGLRALGLLAGLRHRRVRHHRAAARRPVRRVAGAGRPGRCRPLAAGLSRRAVHRDPGRLARARRLSSSSAPRSATGSPGSRRGPWTPPAARCSAPSPSCSSRGRSASRSPARGLAGVSPWSAARWCWPPSTSDARPAERRANAFNNVVGTSFFPRYLEPFAPERIVEVGPGPRGCSPTPTSRPPGQRAQGPRHQRVRPRRRGHRLPLRRRTG